VLQARRTT
jgi:hypothetical protein